jgi:hypothetical protein
MYERRLHTLMLERRLDLEDAQRLLEGRLPLAELLARDGRARKHRRGKNDDGELQG